MGKAKRNPSIAYTELMGFAEFIIGPAEGRTRWLYPSDEPRLVPDLESDG
jgi:hypothetical protein